MSRRAHDGKARELAASRTLNARPEAVVDDAFRGSEFFDARDLVQVKYEMVRRVEADGLSVSAAADAFGFSRQSYYSATRALADEDLERPEFDGDRVCRFLPLDLREGVSAYRFA